MPRLNWEGSASSHSARPRRREQRLDLRFGALGLMQGSDVFEVLAEADVLVEDRGIGDVGEVAASCDRAGGGATDLDLSGRRLEQAGGEHQEGGLAGAVGPDQGNQLSGAELELQRGRARGTRRSCDRGLERRSGSAALIGRPRSWAPRPEPPSACRAQRPRSPRRQSATGSSAIAPRDGPASVQPGRASSEQGPADCQDGDQRRAGGDRVDGAWRQTQVGERVVGRAEGGAGGENESGRQRRGRRRARARSRCPRAQRRDRRGEHQAGGQRRRRRRQVTAEQLLRVERQQLEPGRVVALLGERLDQVERGDEQQRPGDDEEDDACRPGRDRDGAGGARSRTSTRTIRTGGQRRQSLPIATPDRVDARAAAAATACFAAARRRAGGAAGPPSAGR